jgi:hypothetical protein
MLAKGLVGLGVLLLLLAGGLYLTEQSALQMATTSFQVSVQHYASESASYGMMFARVLAALGGLAVLAGSGAAAVGRARRRLRAA